jgi:kynurenine formamidase
VTPSGPLASEPERVRLFGQDVAVIELSQRLDNATSEFEPMPHRIEYFDHEDTAGQVEEKYGLPRELWLDGLVWAHERVTLTTHSGTHIDAPYHYHPTSGGNPARRIDEIPFRWVMGDGVLLDMRGCDRVEGIREHDVRRVLAEIGYQLKPFDIVLVRTDVSRHYGQPGYEMRHPGLRRDATSYMVRQGVRLIGIDAWGLDRAFDVMAEEALAGDTAQLWESHKFGAESEYCQIEKLCNLEQLPAATGFTVLALPVRLASASAAWARVVALVPETALTTPETRFSSGADSV